MFNKIFSKLKNNNEQNSEKFVDVGEHKFLKNFKKITITLLILFVAISYYVLLVPINLRSAQFYSYVLFILCLLTFIFFIDSLFNKKSGIIYKTSVKLIVIIIAALVLSNLYSSPILQAKKYAMLIKKQEGVFETDVKSADFNKLPVVDRDMAIKLGARKMGEMGTLVSQYDIDETYSQICVKGKPLRVTPLVYADTIKWFLNKSNGIPYYINIDMVTQNSTLVKLSSPIKYSLSDKFSRNLYRHIRFGYPTAIISQINFEIDEDGKPYFIASVVEPTIGILGGEDVKAVIVINASTGEMKKYNTDEVPTWIDRVYPAELIIKQLTDNGQYERGFINSKVKQEGVTKPTEGYNYITMGEDIYLYTGITSVLSDESNIGFVFVNMRTKETKFYPVSSAEEFSVMESAAGAVQEKAYKATFPILINLYNRPTYFMALKDDAKLTKMYSLVDAQSYQKVAVGNTIQETVDNYRKITTDIAIESTDIISKEIVVEDVKSVVVDGNTVFYIKVQGEDKIYTAPIDVDATLAFVKQGDILNVLGNDAESTFIVTGLKK
ncbi:hypothetical protein HMPREF9628_01541 [Peptoanaerobacter stomatis]|uniref:CvpA family protein n=1 Tax=Peptoanaerobacter stomatis TaxID=796937 RepID=G9XCG4_9FIRM|nr:hypothetical protein [Peptoanaerobacter stomatis]EHL19357.1 hypothetical protein HMPREF9628_01541 [Peptoanaerobacter stomatis]